MSVNFALPTAACRLPPAVCRRLCSRPTTQTTASNKYDVSKWAALATGLCIAIAAFGGALGQGNATKAALEGIARNPGARDKIFTPMIIGLALIESLVIYALVIAFLLYGKIQL